MKNRVKIVSIVLMITVMFLIYKIAYPRGLRSFDFKEFDQKHHTTLEGSGYRYDGQPVPGVYLFRGAQNGLGYATVTVYDVDSAVVGEDQPASDILEKSEKTLLFLPSTVILYRGFDSKGETYCPSFKAYFSREGCFYVLWINYNDTYTKSDTVINDKDITYIEQYLKGIFP
ncbi:MAG: hypothetical protein IKE21_07260 [Erysipelotrichaceae bacterium]|nr:hypothetical protein [Erysipelotrichaceae bacterium]